MEQLADGRYGNWIFVDVAATKLIDGGDPTSNAFVLYAHNREVQTPLHAQLAWARVLNRAGGNANLGIGVRLARQIWKAGLWTHGTTTYTDDTAAFQNTTTADAELENTTNGNGFLVQSYRPFNALSLNVSTASSGGTPARVIEYSTAGGTWTAITTITSFAASGANYGTGENLIWWSVPTDWVVMDALHGTGITVGMYGVRIRATTAPTTTPAVAASMSIHRVYCPRINVATLTEYFIAPGGVYAPLELEGDAVVLVTSVLSAHPVSVLLRTRG